MPAYEVNFDGLVGPTHNYAGLSRGNVASQRHGGETSNPRAAALEGLAKMKVLAEMGAVQAVLPPHERPSVATLRRLGFAGGDAQVLAAAGREAPHLLAACCSASAMWAANAATVSPSTDTADGRVHVTPANLAHHLHRSIEAETTAAVLRAIFADTAHFVVHDPLPATPALHDEGAANHTRLAMSHGGAGIELFVYGRCGPLSPGERAGVRGPRDDNGQGITLRHPTANDLHSPHSPLDPLTRPRGLGHPLPGGEGARYPARQTLDASRAIARLHQLDPARTLFAGQHPDAIDAGVFHSDVAAVGHLNVLFCHERAWVDQSALLDDLRQRFAQHCHGELLILLVREDEVSLADAVDTYLFNSQLVSRPDGAMALIAPSECAQRESTRRYLDGLLEQANHPIRQVRYVDVRQSMRNGGGPACLRLRVVLTDTQLAAMHQGVRFTDALYERLTESVTRHFRERLSPADLADLALLEESRAAMAELMQIMKLPDL
ncbi:MAG: N-succinylarginine dihydrolase [Phycisphaeraceae bacterium]